MERILKTPARRKRYLREKEIVSNSSENPIEQAAEMFLCAWQVEKEISTNNVERNNF